MRSIEETINALKNGKYDDKLTYLYSCDKNDVKKYSDRYIDVINGFEETFGKEVASVIPLLFGSIFSVDI